LAKKALANSFSQGSFSTQEPRLAGAFSFTREKKR